MHVGEYMQYDPYTDMGRYMQYDPYTDMGRYMQYDPYTDMGRYMQYDPYTDMGQLLIPEYEMEGLFGLGQEEKNILKSFTGMFTKMGVIGGVVQGGVAALLLYNAGKWKGFAKGLGYVGGGIFALGAIGTFIATGAGAEVMKKVEKKAEAKEAAEAATPAPATPAPAPEGGTDGLGLTTEPMPVLAKLAIQSSS